MSSSNAIGLPEALERAATALRKDADAIRPANGDPFALLDLLDAEGRVRVLGWLLENEPDAGGELAQEWADAGGDAADPVIQISPDGLPKPARKALRRAHHRLRSRGEAVPEAARTQVVATLPKVEEQLAEAMISAIDPRGTRIAYLVEAHPAGGARLFVAVLNELLGVVELDVFNAGRSKIKQFIRDFTARKEYPTVEAPYDSVRALVDRIARYQPAKRSFPRAFSEWRSHIGGAPDGAQTPGEVARAALTDADDVGAAIGSIVDLVREQELGPWPAETEALQTIAEKMKDTSEGVVIVSGAARQEQLDVALEEAVSTIYDESLSRKTAERFEESAFFYWKAEQPERATACLTVATAFRSQSPESRTVARAMLDVVLKPVIDSIADLSQKHEGDSESLLVEP